MSHLRMCIIWISSFVWFFFVSLWCICDRLPCHCHAEPLICAVNVETAAAWILFVISLHVAPLASTFDAQCCMCNVWYNTVCHYSEGRASSCHCWVYAFLMPICVTIVRDTWDSSLCARCKCVHFNAGDTPSFPELFQQSWSPKRSIWVVFVKVQGAGKSSSHADCPSSKYGCPCWLRAFSVCTIQLRIRSMFCDRCCSCWLRAFSICTNLRPRSMLGLWHRNDEVAVHVACIFIFESQRNEHCGR